jgi:hypothetical protein
MPIILLGAPMLCRFPVAPECHLSRLYASPRAGFMALIRFPSVFPFVHWTLPILGQVICAPRPTNPEAESDT